MLSLIMSGGRCKRIYVRPKYLTLLRRSEEQKQPMMKEG